MESEWRCARCKKLLGIHRDGRLHLRFARGHEYLVGFPATSVCRGCRTLNELDESRKHKQAAKETAGAL
jgi:hypothetical protein